MLDIDDAIQATTYVSPGKLSLGEGNGTTRTLTIRNNGSSAKTYSLSHVAAAATGPNTFSTTPYLAPASTATFSSTSVTIAAGGSANVDVTITPSGTLPDLSMYSGYVVIGASDGSQFSVPYVGFKGDYQAIQILTGLVALARPTTTPGSFNLAPAGSVFTLAGPTEIPNILVHFHHQVQKLEVEVRTAAGSKLHPVFSNGIEDELLPRSATATGLFAFAWDGMRSARQREQRPPEGRPRRDVHADAEGAEGPRRHVEPRALGDLDVSSVRHQPALASAEPASTEGPPQGGPSRATLPRALAGAPRTPWLTGGRPKGERLLKRGVFVPLVALWRGPADRDFRRVRRLEVRRRRSVRVADGRVVRRAQLDTRSLHREGEGRRAPVHRAPRSSASFGRASPWKRTARRPAHEEARRRRLRAARRHRLGRADRARSPSRS